MSCFALALLFLLATHASFLDLPYHWDELGYFVPAAHDLLVEGRLTPRSTPPNVHPPLVMAYLATAWKLFGFAPEVTRVAMLAVGAATVTATFLLARRLAGERAGWTAAAMLAVSPPFVAQCMLAHLDLAAAMWAALALYWSLGERWWLCGAASAALVLTKETGILVPLTLAAFCRREPPALGPLALPFLALGGWLMVLRLQTGHWLGNAEFARYNVAQALDAGRMALVLLRRLYQLGFANFHWVAVVVIALGGLPGRSWRLLGAIVAAYLALHSMLGGAILFRYLLPALVLLYIATAAALETLRPGARMAAAAGLTASLAACNWWNPPYPFGYEDNLAVVDFVRLQQRAAFWLSENAPQKTVTTAWPLTDALSNPLGGYVRRPIKVRAIESFEPAAWKAVEPEGVQAIALYSRSWEPESGWQRWPPLARILERYFDYRPQLSRQQLLERFPARSVARWERRGQWMEIFVVDD